LVVTGLIENNKIISNSTAKPNDDLILTKPIGTGILSKAMQKGLLSKEIEDLLIFKMSELNKAASESMIEIGVNSCTDITGFGLLGHLLEMMNASNTSTIIDFNKIIFLPSALDLAVAGTVSGSTKENYDFTKSRVHYDKNISESRKMLLNDAQTSGGLLISCPEEKSEILLSSLRSNGINDSAKIGKVIPKAEKDILIRNESQTEF